MTLEETSTQDTWQALRGEFPVTGELAYLNHAAVSPLPRRCRDGVNNYLDELCSFGAAKYPDSPRRAISKARSLGAKLLGTSPESIFMVRSTTQGLGIVATGLPVRPKDNIVLVEREFPANLRPWLPLAKEGVEVRFVPQRNGRILIDDLRAAIDDRTRAVSVSFVQFLSGFRMDLAPVAELCRRHDALLVVDAIQGLGVFPLPVEELGIDFVSADAHKWLMGPEGIGLGYASRRALDRIVPALQGWTSVERPYDFFDLSQPLKTSAARYEEGALNMAGIFGMVGSLELLLGAGIPKVAARVLALTNQLSDALSTRGWRILSPRRTEEESSGILLATRSNIDAAELCGKLASQGIIVSERGGALRISPHAYNDSSDIERLLDVLE